MNLPSKNNLPSNQNGYVDYHKCSSERVVSYLGNLLLYCGLHFSVIKKGEYFRISNHLIDEYLH